MDKISKFLKKLSDKDRDKIENILKQIYSGDTKGLNIKKLKDYNDFYRVRKGKIRIIYYSIEGKVKVFSVNFRGEDTYKF